MRRKQLQEVIVRDARKLARVMFRDVSDFTGHCLLMAGATILAAQKHGLRLCLQAGTAYWPRVTAETDDGVEPNRFGYEWEPGSPATKLRLAMGLLPEMHVWAGDPERQEVVDLTTGSWPKQCVLLTGLTWKAPAPPAYFWGPAASLPAIASYVPDELATLMAARLLQDALTPGMSRAIR